MATFSGFGPETIRFIGTLSDNNTKAWFDANRAAYEEHYLNPAKAFVEVVAEPLQKLIPGIDAEPRVNGSIFRINRDIRFSKDKTPYKDHLDLWFWEGERKGAVSGLFFRLTRDQLILGAGAHGFDPPRLSAYRDAVVDPAKGKALLKIEKTLDKAGLTLGGAHYKTLPRGYAADDPDIARLLKHNALHAAYHIEHPDSLGSAAFSGFCIDKWKTFAPLHNWLMAMS